MPLVIVPALGGPLRGSPVVVGMDGSQGDMVTLQWALRVANAVGGPLNVVYGSDPMAQTFPHPEGATIADRKEMTVRDHVAHVAQSADVEVTLTVEVDHPVSALTRVADQVSASLIVVGRKGAGHLRGHLLGRVPAQLPFRAQRPVAIVPRPTSQ